VNGILFINPGLAQMNMDENIRPQISGNGQSKSLQPFCKRIPRLHRQRNFLDKFSDPMQAYFHENDMRPVIV